ncbi:MAG: hypothetical protein R6V08_02840 [Desulfuromonadales bacterium]
MALFSKSDLAYDYSWTAIDEDDPKVSGEPDSTQFNRKEGYEVLYLINRLAEGWGFNRKESGRELEKMINLSLPEDVRSQEDVKQWIRDNWRKY